MSLERSLLSADGRLAVLSEARAPGGTALVLFNAGYIHRPGPFRLHVQLCRRWAAAGSAAVRVDQPGVGEALRSADRPQLDIALELLDQIQAETGCTRFVVGGICAAADFGWRLALRDTRVAGLLLLDPLARREHWAWRLGQLRLHLGRGPVSWWRTLRRRLPGGGLSSHSDGAPSPTDAELRDWPTAGSEARQLATLVERDVEVFALYTGGAATYFNHPAQFYGGYGAAARDPRVRFTYWQDCDHTFFRPEHRERLLAAVDAWRTQRLTARLAGP